MRVEWQPLWFSRVVIRLGDGVYTRQCKIGMEEYEINSSMRLTKVSRG